MRTALGQLVADFVASLVFLLVFAWSENLLLAASVSIAVALGQVMRARLRNTPLSSVQWVSLGLALGLSTLTLITQDSRFVQLKTSIVHVAVGAAMLKRGWLLPYLPERARTLVPERSLVGWGYAWAGLMFALALANIAVITWLSMDAWGLFVTSMPFVKLCFFGVQYVGLRSAARRARAQLSGSPV